LAPSVVTGAKTHLCLNFSASVVGSNSASILLGGTDSVMLLRTEYSPVATSHIPITNEGGFNKKTAFSASAKERSTNPGKENNM
jgi:hypothetical protein